MGEYLTYLRHNVADLKSLGKEWGMTEEEIQDCIQEVLKKGAEKQTSWWNTARKIWSYIRFLLKIPAYLILILISLSIGFTLLTTYHEGANAYFDKLIQPHGYTIFRYVRLATMPIHNFFDITGYYTAECIIENPLYKEEEEDCFSCMSFKSVKRVNASEFSPGKLYSYMEVMKPIMFKKAYPADIIFEDLRQLYLDNKDFLDFGVKFESSNTAIISSLQQMFMENTEETIKKLEKWQVFWTSTNFKSASVLRKLFPRPEFLPSNAEINRDRSVVISGPKMKSIPLPSDTNNPYQLYTQVTGNRSVLISPIERCSVRCETLMVTLEPGTSLAFNSRIWKLMLLHNGDYLNIGYHTTFQISRK